MSSNPASRPAPRRHRLPVLAGLLCAVLALAGCGGGGGGGGSSGASASPSGQAATESAYLLADFVAQDTGDQFVRVWDPLNPGTAVENVKIQAVDGVPWTSSNLVFSDATGFDPTTGTLTTLGHARAFFNSGGSLYTIDLRGGQSHAPVQLSSAVDISGLVQAIPLDAAGDQAWVLAQASGHDWAVSTGMGTGDAPQSVLGLVPMRDPSTGLPQYLFVTFGLNEGLNAVQPPTYGVRDLSFNPIAVPAVAAMASTDGWLAADPTQSPLQAQPSGLAYLSIGGQLRALRWSAQGVSVDSTAIYTLQDHFFGAFVVATGPAAVYVCDGATLVSLANAVASTVGQFNGAVTALTDAADQVVAAETVGQGQQWEALAKTGGTAVVVATGDSSMQLVGAGEIGLLFSHATQAIAGYLLTDFAGNALQTASGLPVGVVWSAVSRPDQSPAPVAAMSCVPDAARDQCVPGPLQELDLASGAVLTLGQLTAAGTGVTGDQIDGLFGTVEAQTLTAGSFGFGAGDVDARDSWQLMPGSAGSLLQVTNYLP